jgi:hypothetical protein
MRILIIFFAFHSRISLLVAKKSFVRCESFVGEMNDKWLGDRSERLIPRLKSQAADLQRVPIKSPFTGGEPVWIED